MYLPFLFLFLSLFRFVYRDLKTGRLYQKEVITYRKTKVVNFFISQIDTLKMADLSVDVGDRSIR